MIDFEVIEKENRDRETAHPKPNDLTVEQAFAIFMEKYSEAMKELSDK